MDDNIFISLQTLMQVGKKNHKRVAKFFLEYDGNFKMLKLGEVSEKTLTSNATIVRFCQELGFTGFPDFKIALANEAELYKGTENTDAIKDFSYSEHYEAIVKSLKMTELANDKLAINTLVDRIKHSDQVNLFAVGETNIVAQDFQLKLIRIGFHANANTDIHTQHFLASHSTNKTVAIGISYSGTSKSVFKTLKLAKENGATTFLISKPGLPKPTYVDYMIRCSATESGSRVFSTTSRFSILFLLDVVYHEIIATDQEYYQDLLKQTRIIKGR